MKKIMISLIFGLALTVGLQSFASYTLTNSDLNFVKALESKIKTEISKKGESERQKFVNILSTLAKHPSAPAQPKAIVNELLNRLLASSYGYGNNYGYGSTVFTGTSNLLIIRQEILKLVNQERAKVGANPLTINEKLNKAAQLHAEDMAQKNYFDHTSKDGRTFVDRVNAQNYNYKTIGENIARNQRTSTEVMNSRMNSPGHKKNILDKNFKEIGIGLQNRYRVQVFGSSQ